MKRVYASHSELAHAWANGQLMAGTNGYEYAQFSASSMLASHLTIYSYGRHFTIAKRLVNEAGEVLIYLNPQTYSSSTSKQQCIVRGAIRHLPQVSYPSVGDALHSAERLTKEAMEQKNIIKRYDGLVPAFRAYVDAITIAQHMGTPNGGELSTIVEAKFALQATLEAMRPDYDAAVARKQAGVEKARATREANGTELFGGGRVRDYGFGGPYAPRTVEEWREGKGSANFNTSNSNLLRLVGSTVQTSLGVYINAVEARRVWPLLVRCRTRMASQPCNLVVSDRNGSHFDLRSMNQDTFTVGCHTIEWGEAEAMALLLNLVPA